MAYTTINKSTNNFNTKIWTGTSDSTTAVTGIGFEPNWVWIKNRDVADDFMVFDSVRAATKRLFSNSHGAEGTDAQTLTSFDSDGFTTGNNRATGGDSGNKMVAWNWKAGSSASSNSNGSITSSVSVNTTAGFSIVSYTGNGSQPSTVGHGLGVTPDLVLVKPRSIAYSWCMYHKSIGNTQIIYLDSSSAAGGSSVWNNTSPTSSVFTVNDNQVNKSGETHIAYCFKEKTGYSKFGSYTGNGNANGTFVYTGFKPVWVMIKKTDSSHNWRIHDAVRNPSNVIGKGLEADTSDVEYDNVNLDFNSNGFKIRTTTNAHNASGGTYIYMAFGQSLVGSNNIPCTAR